MLMTRALPSILGQTYANMEIIVAAHGCTDGTADRVRALNDPRIKVIEVPRKRTYPSSAMNHWLAGPIAPANAALRIVKGEWIARLDDDDVWLSNHLHNLIGFALANDYEFVSSAYRTHTGHKAEPYCVHGMNIGGTQTWVYRSYLKFMSYNPDCWRKTWDRNNDIDLQNRFVRAGVRMGYLNRITCEITPRPGETEIGSKAYLADKSRTEAKFAFR